MFSLRSKASAISSFAVLSMAVMGSVQQMQLWSWKLKGSPIQKHSKVENWSQKACENGFSFNDIRFIKKRKYSKMSCRVQFTLLASTPVTSDSPRSFCVFRSLFSVRSFFSTISGSAVFSLKHRKRTENSGFGAAVHQAFQRETRAYPVLLGVRQGG